jgi:hypothetical protein
MATYIKSSGLPQGITLNVIPFPWVIVTDTQFGAKGDGINDDTAAINAAISSVSIKGGVVYFPAGNYKVTTPINMANLVEAKVILKGCGSPLGGPPTYNTIPTSGSNIYGVTGNYAAIEMQGSSFATLEDIGMYSLTADGANSSAIGIYTARTTLQHYVQMQHFNRVFINLAAKSGANAGRGSIAFFNQTAEQFFLNHCYLGSDTPMALMDNNAYSFYPYYGTLNLIASMTVGNFNQTAFVALSAPHGAIELRGAQTMLFENCYYGTNTGGVNLPIAVESYPGVNACQTLKFIGGQVETYDSFIRLGDLSMNDLDIDLTIAGPTYAGPLILVDQNNNQKLYNLRANIASQHPASVKLVDSTVASPVTLIGGEITINSQQTINNANLVLQGTVIKDLNGSAVNDVSVNSASHYTDAYSHGAYGQMWYHNDSAPYTLALTTGTPAQIACFDTASDGQTLNAFSFSYSTSALTCLIPGTYKVNYSLTMGSSTSNHIYRTRIAINGVEQLSTASHTKPSNSTDERASSGCAIISLNVNDVVTIQMTDTTAGNSTATLFSLNVNLDRIGN